MTTKAGAEFYFDQDDFDQLFEEQNGKCFLSGRKIDPFSTKLEYKNPYADDDEYYALSNYCLVHRNLAPLLKNSDTDDIIQHAAEITEYKGIELGYGLTRVEPNNDENRRVLCISRNLTRDEIVLMAKFIIEQDEKEKAGENPKSKGGKKNAKKTK